MNIIEKSGFYQPQNDKLLIPTKDLIKNLDHHLVNQFIQEWSHELQATSGKLRIYKQIKHIFKYEMDIHLNDK